MTAHACLSCSAGRTHFARTKIEAPLVRQAPYIFDNGRYISAVTPKGSAPTLIRPIVPKYYLGYCFVYKFEQIPILQMSIKDRKVHKHYHN